jgi:hypothetical protein
MFTFITNQESKNHLIGVLRYKFSFQLSDISSSSSVQNIENIYTIHYRNINSYLDSCSDFKSLNKKSHPRNLASLFIYFAESGTHLDTRLSPVVHDSSIADYVLIT